MEWVSGRIWKLLSLLLLSTRIRRVQLTELVFWFGIRKKKANGGAGQFVLTFCAHRTHHNTPKCKSSVFWEILELQQSR